MPRQSIEPRLLTKEQAASYCGISSPVFGDKCPVRPVALGEGDRLKRWDRNALDAWIDGLSGKSETFETDWISKVVEGSDGRGARKRA